MPRTALGSLLLVAFVGLVVLVALGSCAAPAPARATTPERETSSGVYALVLGTAQDAGLPQVGCFETCCETARRDPAAARLVASLLIADERSGKRWLVGQGNNVFIFPGLGLGALAVGARKVTNGMTNAASKTLAAQVTAEELAQGLLFPSVSRLPVVSFEVAVAVARQAVRDGVAELTVDDLERHIARAIWEPDYPEYEPAR